MKNVVEQLEEECWKEAIEALKISDAEVFINNMALLTTNRNLAERRHFFTKLYSELKEWKNE